VVNIVENLSKVKNLVFDNCWGMSVQDKGSRVANFPSLTIGGVYKFSELFIYRFILFFYYSPFFICYVLKFN